MPQIGDIETGRGAGYSDKSHKYIWLACPDCGKERWVALRGNEPQRLRCRHCRFKGSRNPLWKNGRVKASRGYIYIRLNPDDFFYPMINHSGYTLEHRFVMAKHLGRCLQPFENVHHKNGIKDDNRIENLELTATTGEHSKNHSRGYQNGYLKGLFDGRDRQIKELRNVIEEQTRQIKLLQKASKG